MLPNAACCVRVEISRRSPKLIPFLIPKFVEYVTNGIVFCCNGANDGNAEVVAVRRGNSSRRIHRMETGVNKQSAGSTLFFAVTV